MDPFGPPATAAAVKAGRIAEWGYRGKAAREKSMTLDAYTYIGFAGALVVVLAYWANQADRLASTDWKFPAANLAGSVLILVSLFRAWNWPSVVIEIFWSAISLYGILRHRLQGASGP